MPGVPPSRRRTVLPPPGSEPLGFRDKVLLAAEILRTYAVVRRLIGRVDLPAALRDVREESTAVGGPDGIDSHRAGIRLGRAVSRTLGVLPTDSRCLTESLVLSRLLARRGIESSLVIGVKTEPSFTAHAWVEEGGLPVLPPGDYPRLVEL